MQFLVRFLKVNFSHLIFISFHIYVSQPFPFFIPSFFPFSSYFSSLSLRISLPSPFSLFLLPFSFSFHSIPFLPSPFSFPLRFPFFSSLYPSLPHLIFFPNSLILFPPRGRGRELYTPLYRGPVCNQKDQCSLVHRKIACKKGGWTERRLLKGTVHQIFKI